MKFENISLTLNPKLDLVIFFQWSLRENIWRGFDLVLGINDNEFRWVILGDKNTYITL